MWRRRTTAGLAVSALLAAALTVPLAGTTSAAAVEAAPATVADFADPKPSFLDEYTDNLDSAKSYATIKHLVEEIGPRLNGTRQERQAAEYLGSLLEPLGFEISVESWGPVSTKRVADVTAVGSTLPGNPIWQFSASTAGKFTGDAAPVEAQVVYAATGQSAADFPATTAGKIALIEATTAATRNTAAINAVAAGAVGVLFTSVGGTGAPATITLATPQPSILVMGGGGAHNTWIKARLAEGPLTLRIVTNEYVTPMGTNIIATRHALGDPEGDSAPIVMVGAHIDSVLGAPGAHDDASGNGVGTEIIRVLSELPLDKEIRFGGFGGEEAGLLGARAYAATIPVADRARFVGEWQMDMVGTPYGPAKLWALTPNGARNLVVDSAYESAARTNYTDFSNCRLGQSDHQAFFDIGIPSALFIWLDYRVPTGAGTCTTANGSYVTEPEYHRPTDTMANISQPRLQITLDVIGGAVLANAMNKVSVQVNSDAGNLGVAGLPVLAECGDGAREFGTTDANGLATGQIPHLSCSFSTLKDGTVTSSDVVDVHGDAAVDLEVDTTTVAATTPAAGATYQVGSEVLADFECADPAGSVTCIGTVDDGEAINTTQAGAQTFRIRAVDARGNVTTRSINYTVVTNAVSITATAAPSVFGTAPIVDIAVTGADGTVPAGRYDVIDRGAILATGMLNAGRVRTALPLQSLAVGNHTLTVVYSGSGTHSATSITLPIQVTPAVGTLRIDVTVPTEGATYRVGSEVLADFGCQNSDFAVVCAGTVDDGARVDTRTPGTKTFTVNARDVFGATATRTVTYQVVSGPSVISATAGSAIVGKDATITATVSGDGPVSGRVDVLSGTRILASGFLEGGSVDLAVPTSSLGVGEHTLTVNYLGSDAVAPATTTTTVTLTKAPVPPVTNPPAKATVKVVLTTKKVVLKKTRARLQVTVTAPGRRVAGTVKVRSGGKVIGSATVRNGKARVTLKVFRTAGTKNVTVVWQGSSTVKPANKTIKIKVVRKR